MITAILEALRLIIVEISFMFERNLCTCAKLPKVSEPIHHELDFNEYYFI